MNIKNNQSPKSLRELIGQHKEESWIPLQNEALFPREILQPLYEKWRNEYATSNLAEDFYYFLLKQSK
jgi:hypothetical protein